MIKLLTFDIQHSNEFFNLTDKNREYLKNWLPWLDSIKNEMDTIDFLQKSIQSDMEGTSLNKFITYNNVIVGTIGLRNISKKNGIVGYWIDENYQGKGITTNSLKILIDDVKDKKLTDSIMLRCSPTNLASSSVAKKCGFKYIDTIKNGENLYGEFNDLDVYEYKLT